jgi:hypothetical protein
MRIEERVDGSHLFHEGVYSYTRSFRMVRVGNRHFIFSQLIAIDPRWHPHVTPVVGEIEMRSIGDSTQHVCIAKFDLQFGPCGTQSGLRAVEQLPIRHLGGYIRVDAAGGANCFVCHRDEGVSGRRVLDLAPAEATAYAAQRRDASLQQLEPLLARLRARLQE